MAVNCETVAPGGAGGGSPNRVAIKDWHGKQAYQAESKPINEQPPSDPP